MSVVTEPAPLKGRWVAMFALLISAFMNLIDVTIVNVAIPSLADAFGATDSQIEWVVAVYILVYALLLLPMGRLGDVIGRRRMFVIGVIVFTIGSALCGMAPSIYGLVGARVVQAIGGAMMTPQTLALVPVLFPPSERGLAYALFGISAGLASVTGPLLGGLLIGADLWGLDWRPIFLVNIPVGVLAVAGAMRFVPKVPGDAGLRLDYGGVMLAGLALLLILFPLIEGRQIGWPWWCFALIALAFPVFYGFLAWERRQAAKGAPQLVPASLLSNPQFVVGSGIVVLIFAGMPGFFLVMAVLLQVGNGLTPLESGLTTLPFSVGVIIASGVSGRLGLRWPRRRIATGALSMAVGMTILRWAVPEAGETLQRSAFVLPLFIAGLGLGTGISPLFTTVLSSVTGDDSGSASGSLQSFQQVGGALGLAVVGEIFFSYLRVNLPGAADPALVYSEALRWAVLFNITSFIVVALMVWRLPQPKEAPSEPLVHSA
ncbi:MFS transporter [Flavimaricola marinus]|uniref:MFS transporter n=1 Tax=Flavimaricola marinus TaxID=1819565 RepID=UPI000B8B6F1D|nr:MFS transporter [Flavimaricola marinus]